MSVMGQRPGARGQRRAFCPRNSSCCSYQGLHPGLGGAAVPANMQFRAVPASRCSGAHVLSWPLWRKESRLLRDRGSTLAASPRASGPTLLDSVFLPVKVEASLRAPHRGRGACRRVLARPWGDALSHRKTVLDGA